MFLGYALLMQGRAEDAIAALEPAARRRHDAEIDTQLAIALRRAGRPDDALARLKRATKRNRLMRRHSTNSAACLRPWNAIDEAIEAFQRGLDIAPMMPEFSIQLGHAFLQRRQLHRCQDRLCAGAGDFAGFSRRAVRYGHSASGAGESETAAEYFRRCLMMRPNDGGHLAQPRTLSAGARPARCRIRVLPRGARAAMQSAMAARCLRWRRRARGRFWLKPSEAAALCCGKKT